MTKEQIADKEIEIVGWMTKKGYDRKASKEIAPIIVQYLQSQVKPLNIDNVSPRSFGMVRWYDNTDDDVACTSIEKAKEYVEKYNKLSGKKDCYVDEDVYLLLDEA